MVGDESGIKVSKKEWCALLNVVVLVSTGLFVCAFCA